AERSGPDRVEMGLADFSRLTEVRRLADELLAGHDRLDVLVNNAGLFSPHYRLSADGFELTFAVNHLAPFLLTNLLLDRLKASAPARIVTVASEAHRRNRLDIADMTRPADWTMMRAYGRSKLCNILFTRELARRLAGTGVTANCLHPGFVATRFGDQAGGVMSLVIRAAKLFAISPEKGAETIVHLASSPEVAGSSGGYFDKCRPATPTTEARDDAAATRLWAESVRIAGIDL
ncbi:MAG TPA: SDR family NAD(P)-dependent oxidoreductase, partial [Dongiaceae bacterium]